VREIKAFVRHVKLEEVIHSLEGIGVTDMTVLDVKEIGRETDPRNLQLSVEMSERYAKVSKIEIVCSKERVDPIVETLRRAAYTGEPGDGIIYVTPVEMSVKIRTGASAV
jgi:nitrogen regulatory protein P-II 1